MATKKTVKKIDPKKVVKLSVVEMIREMYEDQGLEVSCGTDYGFTDTTLVAHLKECDVQIKIVSPSAKVGMRYQKVEE